MADTNVKVVFESSGSRGIEAFDNAIKHLVDSLGDMKDALKGATSSTSEMLNPLKEVKSRLDGFITSQFKLNQAFEGFTRLKQSFDYLTAPAIEFDAAQKQLQSTTGVTNEELDELGAFAREAGIALGSSGAEVLGGMEKIANGIEISKIGGVAGLKQLTYQISLFAKASNVDFETAAKAIVGAKGQFNLSAEEISRAMNVMARGSQLGSGEVIDQIESFKIAAVTAADFGLSIEETTAAIELLAGANIKGSEAGTALRNMLGGMKASGVDFSKGFSSALEQVNGRMLDYQGLSQLVGRDAIASFKILAKQTDEMKRLTDATTGSNAVLEIADIKMSTFAQDIAVARANINDLLVGIGSNIAGVSEYLEYLSLLGQSFFAVSQISITLTETFKVLKAVQWAASIESLKSAFAKIGEAYATYGLVGANGALITSFNLLRAAMLANPITAIITAFVALGAAVYALWENFDWFRGGVYAAWEGLKMVFDRIVGTLKIIGGLVKGITTADWSTFKDGLKQSADSFDVTRISKAYDSGKKDFKTEKDKEKENEQLIESQKTQLQQMKSGLFSPQATTESAPVSFMPNLPSLGGVTNPGTASLSAGSIVTNTTAAPVTNSQSVNVNAINITVTTPRDLVDNVKNEVLKALASAISPTVAAR